MVRTLLALCVGLVLSLPVPASADNDTRCRTAYRQLGHLMPHVPAGGDRRPRFDPVFVIATDQFDRVGTDRCIVASYQGIINGRHTILLWDAMLRSPYNRYLEATIQHELAHAEGWRH